MRALLVATTSTTIHAFLMPLAFRLRQEGWDVQFACSTESFPDAPSRRVELEETGFVIHDIPFARNLDPFKDFRACRLLTRLIGKEAFALVHTHTSKAGFIGRLAARNAGCPVVVHTAYDLYHRAYPRGWKRRLFLAIEQLAARWCDAELFISRAVLDEARNGMLKAEDDLVFVGHGIDVSRYAEREVDRDALRARYAVGSDELMVGSVGRLVANKGMDILIPAMARIAEGRPGVKCVIAGDGPLRADLEARVEQLGLGRCVKFAGHLPSTTDVMDFMASLDVFVLPTRREGLGVVFLEAMALRRPVVGSRLPPITEVVKDGLTGLLANPDDPESFAHAINSFLEDGQLRDRMGLAGLEHVRKEYDQATVQDRIVGVYERLLKSKGLRSRP